MLGDSGVKRFFTNNWEKIVLWAILIGLMVLLRPFFLLIFETFLITYITHGAVRVVRERLRLHHRLATVLVFVTFVALLFTTLRWIGPQLVAEVSRIGKSFAGDGEEQVREKVVRQVERLVTRVAGEAQAHAMISSDEYADLRQTFKTEITSAAKAAVPDLLQGVVTVIKFTWQIVISTLLAILFSFILVLDWQRISAKVSELAHSRVRTFYLGAAPHLAAFAVVLGKALRAQAIIATVNCVLTALGLWYFHMDNIALLSAVVFVCGFIPVLGTFLSSIPIILFGLVQEPDGGLVLGVKLLILILLVHALEAYVLNPKITGDVLRVHPLLVLVLLVMGERFFGVWGMIVGVPIGYYLLSVLAKREDAPPPSNSEGAESAAATPPAGSSETSSS